MPVFSLYFKLGIRHILDIYSVGYILFLVSLIVVFPVKDWKRVILLMIFFICGYSVTLVMATYKVVGYNYTIIQFLVPLTIFITSVSNILKKKEGFHYKTNFTKNYVLAILFGLIHGFGYAEYLKGPMIGETRVFGSLAGFCLGLNLGQLIIVISFMVIAYLFVNLAGVNRRDWIMVISSGIAGIALTIMFESKFW